MRSKILFLILITCLSFSFSFGQCSHTLSINSFSSVCNGGGMSTVTINVTVLFGNGNNSATISYNIGAGEVVAVIMEDDAGDIINQTYMFDVPSCDPYTVTLTAWTNPSGGGTSCTDPPPVIADIVLPVTFGDFKLIRNLSVVDIYWTTFSEINNERFEVQRSSNGLDFVSVGSLPGRGNSLSKIEYSYQDKLPEAGVYYYRIKQVDLDGLYSFSDLRTIVYDGGELMVYPNPAREFLNVSSRTVGIYSIYEMTTGKLVKNSTISEELSRIDISDLPQGVYFMMDAQGLASCRFVKK